MLKDLETRGIYHISSSFIFVIFKQTVAIIMDQATGLGLLLMENGREDQYVTADTRGTSDVSLSVS